MGRPESQPLAAIDDTLAALSAIRGSVAVLAARLRSRMNRDDRDELSAILDATDRIRIYQNDLRAPLSVRYQSGDRRDDPDDQP